MDNDISILVGIGSSFEVLGEERVQGSSKYVVRNGTEVNDNDSLPRLEPIVRIGAEILKDPINDGYIPTPTFSVVG